MILAPTYLGNHSYPQYEKMQTILARYLKENAQYTIDVDFFHSNEVDPYIRSVFIPVVKNENLKMEAIFFTTKSKERMKKVIKAFQSSLYMIGPIIEEDNCYTIEVFI